MANCNELDQKKVRLKANTISCKIVPIIVNFTMFADVNSSHLSAIDLRCIYSHFEDSATLSDCLLGTNSPRGCYWQITCPRSDMVLIF